MQYLISGYPATTVVPQVITRNLFNKRGHRGGSEPQAYWSQLAIGSVTPSSVSQEILLQFLFQIVLFI